MVNGYSLGFWLCFIVLFVVCRLCCCCCLLEKSHKYTVARALHTHTFTFWFIGCSAGTVVQVWCELGTFSFKYRSSTAVLQVGWSNSLPLFCSWVVSQGEDIGCLLEWKSYCSELRQNIHLNCCRNLESRTQRKMHHMWCIWKAYQR